MTRRLMLSVSQKLASWKGSAKDAKAGKKHNPYDPCLLIK
jgi:hypothetical protein